MPVGNDKSKVTVAAAAVPVLGEYDVVVCGGGPAGIGAAVAAGRAGARTLLIEATSCLGGLIGNAGLRGFCDSPGGPIFDELVERLLELGAAQWRIDTERFRPPGRLWYHPETARALTLEMVTEADAEVLLATFAEGAWVTDDRVAGVFIATKRARQLVRAKAVIDCTADADIAADAGAPFRYGDPQDGHIQVCCFRWVIGEVDAERFARERPGDEELAALFAQAVREGAIRVPDGLFDHDPATFPFDAETGALYLEGWEFEELDATDPVQNARALAQSQLAALQIVRWCRAHLPGYEQCRVERFPTSLGIRESRRIIGHYTLTQEDVLAGRKFDDGVVPAWFWLDLHDPPPHQEPHTLEYVKASQPPAGDWYEIPYRSLLPRGIKGLLVAGRSISADRKAHGSLRIMPTCMFIGTAAGTAAAIAAAEGTDVSELAGARLKRTLLADTEWEIQPQT